MKVDLELVKISVPASAITVAGIAAHIAKGQPGQGLMR